MLNVNDVEFGISNASGGEAKRSPDARLLQHIRFEAYSLHEGQPQDVVPFILRHA
jgi:hypothetical protein